MAWFNRRPPKPPRRALTASAKEIDLLDRSERGAFKKRIQDRWQETGWKFYDEVPEVGHGATYIGNSLSRLRLFAGFEAEPDEPPIPVQDAADRGLISEAEAGAAIAVRDRLDSPSGGRPQLQSSYGKNIFVAGECYLVGRPDPLARGGERFDIYSPNQIEVTDRGWAVKDAPDKPRDQWVNIEEADPSTMVVRLWEPNPMWNDLPDSSIRRSLMILEELYVATLSMRATMLSRVPAGVWVIPDTLDFAGSFDDTMDSADGQGRIESTIVDDIMNYFTTALTPGNAAQVAPYVMMADPADCAALKDSFVKFDRSIDSTLMEFRKELVQRFANGSDLPAEVLLGMVDVSRWNAWQIQEDAYKAYIEPRGLMMADDFTSSWYQKALAVMLPGSPNIFRFRLGVDPSALVVHPNRVTDFKDAYTAEVPAVSAEALRRVIGATEDDAPTPEEIALRTATPANDLDGSTPNPGEPPEPQETDDRPRQDDDDGPDRAALIAAGRRLAAKNVGERLADADRALLHRLLVAADQQMRRTLEKAGARLRTAAQRSGAVTADAINQVHNFDVAATLGKAIVGQLDVNEADLLDDEWEGLRNQFESWVAGAQRHGLGEVQRLGDLSPEQIDHIQTAQSEDRDAAWVLLVAALGALARQRLFDPHPAAPQLGEHDPTLTVPPNIIRESLARAGGAAPRRNANGAVVVGPNDEPVMGVTTGPTMIDAFSEVGYLVTQKIWVYGDASARHQPFEPHQDLDGVDFRFDDDIRLLNNEAWPPEPFYFPGDHTGCLCTVEPFIAAAPALESTEEAA